MIGSLLELDMYYNDKPMVEPKPTHIFQNLPKINEILPNNPMPRFVKLKLCPHLLQSVTIVTPRDIYARTSKLCLATDWTANSNLINGVPDRSKLLLNHNAFPYPDRSLSLSLSLSSRSSHFPVGNSHAHIDRQLIVCLLSFKGLSIG